MREFKREVEASTIVFAGSFNPSIFHPAWFASQGLITELERSEAKVEIMTPEGSVIRIGDIELSVQLERFQLLTLDPGASDQMKDLATGTFGVLEHTPLKAVGLNLHQHFKMSSVDAWHTVGHTLAPKEPWDGLLDAPIGTRSIQIEGKRRDSSAMFLRVTLEPSQKIMPGVYVSTHEHYPRPDNTPISELLSIVSDQWEPAQRHAHHIAETILSRCLEER